MLRPALRNSNLSLADEMRIALAYNIRQSGYTWTGCRNCSWRSSAVKSNLKLADLRNNVCLRMRRPRQKNQPSCATTSTLEELSLTHFRTRQLGRSFTVRRLTTWRMYMSHLIGAWTVQCEWFDSVIQHVMHCPHSEIVFKCFSRCFIMRPSSLGGGRILRRTLSVCPSVPLSLPSVTSRHLANYNDTHVLFGEGRISYGHLGRTNSS